MSRVITFSRTFPAYHPRAGQQTNFVEKIWEGFSRINQEAEDWRRWNIHELNETMSDVVESYALNEFQPKHHTIRAGHRWKVGDWFSPRVWSGKPYNSKMIQFAPDIQVKKVWDFNTAAGCFSINDKLYSGFTQQERLLLRKIAGNDGLDVKDLLAWIDFQSFDGQIICWNESIEY